MLKFLFGALAVSVQAYFVEIDTHKEECFHVKVTSRTKVRSKKNFRVRKVLRLIDFMAK